MDLKTLPLVGNAREVTPWIEAFARIGFAAKGVLYLSISSLAASAALGVGGKRDPDSHQAMQKLFAAPFGRIVVGIIALGLVGYAVWRIIEGIADPQRRGHGPKAIALRAGSIVRGVMHLVLAVAAGTLAVYRQDNSDGSGWIKSWTGRALEMPGGTLLLWAIAIGLSGYGLYQLYCAFRAKLSNQLELGRVRARRAIVGISRFGIAARGVVFITIGVLLARAVRTHDPHEAGGIGDSLRELFTFGRWPYLAIALGLGAYGIYEAINAKHRRIDVV